MRAMAVVGASLGIVGLVLLGGCTSESGGDDGSAASAAHGAMAPLPGSVTDQSAGGRSSDSDAKTTVFIQNRALIRTAEIRVAVKKGTVGTQASRAEDIATAYGGEVFSDDRTSGDKAIANLTLKVPPDSLEEVLGRLAALGTETARNVSTEDVTQQVADVASRVQSARESIARLRTLYGHATKVSDVIAIEGELATRESDLESLEAQQHTLDAQTSMATVHLDLTTAAPAPAPVKKHSNGEHGIGGAFVTGWHGFTAAAAWVGRACATALPFLVAFGLVLVAGGYVWRRRPTPTPPPVPPTP